MTIDRLARQHKVLEAIVKAHIETALPVGSKYIARILGFSSATIRNAMSELEKAGYVRQPYTSAGRIPTDLGYRRYVDSMMHVSELSQDSVLSRLNRFVNEKRLFEEVIEATSRAISTITNYTGIALSPNNRLYFDGTYRMLEQPEFMELETVRNFLKAIEEREELVHIMNQDLEARGTIIHIGRENIFEELSECTIITSSYKFENRVSGSVGVIGPMRMNYEEIIPMIESLAEMTTEALEGITG
jgi:transcriptional regulator of heat shock response